MIGHALLRTAARRGLRLARLGLCVALTTGCGQNNAASERAGALPHARLSAAPATPELLFVNLEADDSFHRVGRAALTDPDGPAYLTSLVCDRVYAAGHRGLCLTSTTEGTSTRWWGQVFDERFEPLGRVALSGWPSRVRVSPDGTLAGATVFESGHSYAEHGFSTKTSLIDLERSTTIADLEAFETHRDGRLFTAVDFNFWGITFASDSDTFYATLDTGGVSHLVRGSVRARHMDVVRAGVECPSLSPDGTTIAFKKRVGAKSLGWWQIATLNLASLEERVITRETRSVDDQVEWLDADRVVYHLTGGVTAADLWTVRVDNTQDPQLLRRAAYSPATIR